MMTILHINSSIRNAGSVSRQLSSEFMSKWKVANPGDVVIERDLASNPVPHLTEQMMGAFFTPADQRSAEQARTIELADGLAEELLRADVIVLGAPMYNFSISSALKAWIDHVTRAGLTFNYTETGPVGLVTGKKVYLFTASGGVYSEGSAQAMNFQETYLRAVLGFIGLTDITVVRAEGLAMGVPSVDAALTRGRQAIAGLVAA
ncbi:FMN-dependent NADH-azoreductase [Burkholderia sp. Bp8963]|uniref:FMN-dependent NADH-azoreductase n=1 Tax=Burkholderia sp. Bp8963 TaxID=2184547 RepID=UPI000F5B2814|nr:FMN-dependent NADH-azoreductase [Burkholderia sp. Bp8963]RQS67007.1 FMN-dependent NADH-azoreductase [Burkholderia sp. Bp8963]